MRKNKIKAEKTDFALTKQELPLNCLLNGDCIDLMQTFPDASLDLIFADPPYNLQLKNELYRPDQSKVEGVFEDWDKFASFEDYDNFTRQWLSESRRLLKENGTIWVIGSYHNIFRVGCILQDLGFWILNDIVWIKNNPMPNFKGTRFNNAHETLIWASKSPKARYTFHYQSLKTMNDDLQMRSDWYLPICQGEERLKENGQKIHATQKPEGLLHRILIATTNVGDNVLDPFSGSGTTAAVAKKLNRNYIGIEKDEKYYLAARERLQKVTPLSENLTVYHIEKSIPKVPFGNLLGVYTNIGEEIFSKGREFTARILSDGNLQSGTEIGSIHRLSALFLGKPSNNGWKFWYVLREGKEVCIDELRYAYAKINQNL
jgi:DNA modification methylase